MKKTLILAYGIAVYILFLATFTYLVGFVSNQVVPKGIDDGTPSSLGTALAVNGGILALFAIQHTIMARLTFKRWWTRIIPAAAERSTFVLATCSILILLVVQWRPLPEIVWQVEGPLATLLWIGSGLGWGLVLLATFLIDHFDLFGLKQVIWNFIGKDHQGPVFQENAVYRRTRHPLYLGFLTAFWCTPVMTQGHLMFALIVTGYLMVAIRIEESTLIAVHGDAYREYRRRVPMILPLRSPRTASSAR